MTRRCAWPPCRRELEATAAPSALYCSKQHRQAAWRLSRDIGRARAADRPLRLAYADPPYPGLSRRYYGDHPDYAGEVDHAALLSRLQAYDGWALSTSARALPQVLSLLEEHDGVRVAAWVRGARPQTGGATGPWSAWEPVVYRGARPLVSPSPGEDVLHHFHHPRRSGPQIMGAKPWAFLAWLFRDLLQARAGDTLDDLFPGSGGVRLAWDRWTSPLPASDGASLGYLDDAASPSTTAVSDGWSTP